MKLKSTLKLLLLIPFLSWVIIFWSCDSGKKEIKSYSTIDSTMQYNIQKLLENKIKYEDCEWACAVVMETKTGEIKTLVNLAINVEDSVSEKLIRVPDFASSRLILSGHLFAFASLLACVEDEYIDVKDIVVKEKELRILDFLIRDNSDKEADTISILDAFQLKSNTAIAKIVFNKYKDNPDKFIERIKQFELDKSLGLNWIKEPLPIIATPASNNWSNISLPMMSIGYESKHTPLQLLSFYNAVINKGNRIKPVIEKSDTLKLPILLNQSICSKKSISEGLKLLMYNQIHTDSVNSPFFGHSTVVSDFNQLNRTRTYQMITVAFSQEVNPKYSCIVVINSNRATYSNIAFLAMRDILKYLPNLNK